MTGTPSLLDTSKTAPSTRSVKASQYRRSSVFISGHNIRIAVLHQDSPKLYWPPMNAEERRFRTLARNLPASLPATALYGVATVAQVSWPSHLKGVP
jgi:hypothetical protein